MDKYQRWREMSDQYYNNVTIEQLIKDSRKVGIILSKVHTLTDATFAEFVQSAPVVVVDFFATWCGPCKMLSTVLDELSTTYTIGKLDVDENPNTPTQYGVMSVPTLVVFRNGEPVKTLVGYKGKAELERELADLV